MSKLLLHAPRPPRGPVAPEAAAPSPALARLPWPEPDRATCLAAAEPAPGAYVLYWMQRGRRAADNPALAAAVAAADALGLPLLVLYVLPDEGLGTPAQGRFLLGGLAETAAELRSRGAAFRVLKGQAPKLVADWAADAALVLCDAGRLREERAWRAELARRLALSTEPRALYEVETEALVPPALASPKEEWSAATFRRRIEGAIGYYLEAEAPDREPRISARSLGLDGGDELLACPDEAWRAAYPGDRAAELLRAPEPGARAARLRFEAFVERGLADYDQARNDPARLGGSGMSPYLRFGQVSARRLARAALAARSPGSAAFLEQLVVRRELAVNFVLRNPDYDRYEGLPAWSRRSLAEAAADERKPRYSGAELEAAATEDPFWNAAQDEMVLTGSMQGYLRMYWAKRILAWSPSPEEAFETALRLNDRYSLDGRDPNGYAGVAWCFGKHDRPWKRRPVFGTVRIMTASGLARKFDMEAYLTRIAALRAEARSGSRGGVRP